MGKKDSSKCGVEYCGKAVADYDENSIIRGITGLECCESYGYLVSFALSDFSKLAFLFNNTIYDAKISLEKLVRTKDDATSYNGKTIGQLPQKCGSVNLRPFLVINIEKLGMQYATFSSKVKNLAVEREKYPIAKYKEVKGDKVEVIDIKIDPERRIPAIGFALQEDATNYDVQEIDESIQKMIKSITDNITKPLTKQQRLNPDLMANTAVHATATAKYDKLIYLCGIYNYLLCQFSNQEKKIVIIEFFDMLCKKTKSDSLTKVIERIEEVINNPHSTDRGIWTFVDKVNKTAVAFADKGLCYTQIESKISFDETGKLANTSEKVWQTDGNSSRALKNFISKELDSLIIYFILKKKELDNIADTDFLDIARKIILGANEIKKMRKYMVSAIIKHLPVKEYKENNFGAIYNSINNEKTIENMLKEFENSTKVTFLEPKTYCFIVDIREKYNKILGYIAENDPLYKSMENDPLIKKDDYKNFIEIIIANLDEITHKELCTYLISKDGFKIQNGDINETLYEISFYLDVITENVSNTNVMEDIDQQKKVITLAKAFIKMCVNDDTIDKNKLLEDIILSESNAIKRFLRTVVEEKVINFDQEESCIIENLKNYISSQDILKSSIKKELVSKVLDGKKSIEEIKEKSEYICAHALYPHETNFYLGVITEDVSNINLSEDIEQQIKVIVLAKAFIETCVIDDTIDKNKLLKDIISGESNVIKRFLNTVVEKKLINFDQEEPCIIKDLKKYIKSQDILERSIIKDMVSKTLDRNKSLDEIKETNEYICAHAIYPSLINANSLQAVKSYGSALKNFYFVSEVDYNKVFNECQNISKCITKECKNDNNLKKVLLASIEGFKESFPNTPTKDITFKQDDDRLLIVINVQFGKNQFIRVPITESIMNDKNRSDFTTFVKNNKMSIVCTNEAINDFIMRVEGPQTKDIRAQITHYISLYYDLRNNISDLVISVIKSKDQQENIINECVLLFSKIIPLLKERDSLNEKTIKIYTTLLFRIIKDVTKYFATEEQLSAIKKYFELALSEIKTEPSKKPIEISKHVLRVIGKQLYDYQIFRDNIKTLARNAELKVPTENTPFVIHYDIEGYGKDLNDKITISLEDIKNMRFGSCELKKFENIINVLCEYKFKNASTKAMLNSNELYVKIDKENMQDVYEEKVMAALASAVGITQQKNEEKTDTKQGETNATHESAEATKKWNTIEALAICINAIAELKRGSEKSATDDAITEKDNLSELKETQSDEQSKPAKPKNNITIDGTDDN